MNAAQHEAGKNWADKVYTEKLSNPKKLPKLGFKNASPEFLAYRALHSIADAKLYIKCARSSVKQLRPMSNKNQAFWQGVVDRANEIYLEIEG